MSPQPLTDTRDAAKEMRGLGEVVGGGADAVEVKDGETVWGKSLKVRERLQFTASIWLFHHLVPIGRKTQPILTCHWQKLSVAPLMSRKGHQ